MPTKTRRPKQPLYQHFKLSKRLTRPDAKLPGSLILFRRSINLLLSRPRLFGGLLLIFTALNLLLVRGLGGSVDLPQLKSTINEIFSGEINQLGTAVALLGYLGSAALTPPSEGAAFNQNFLILLVSLAMIWLLRQIGAGKLVSLKRAFYGGMYPLVPFVLVLGVIGLQLLPAILGNTVFSLVINGGLAVTVLEKWLWGLLFGLLVLLSLYMLSSSIFGLYIVTLPNMTPLNALRSARQLVQHRRWLVMRRLLGLPLILILVTLAVMLPLIIYLPAVAEPALLGLSLSFWLVAHTYIYNLYKELL